MTTSPDPAYAALKPWRLPDGLLYGPFPTRRKGRALGVNFLPPSEKVCSFNCGYCQCGWTPRPPGSGDWRERCPTVQQVGEGLEAGFSRLDADGAAPDAIVVSGNGEPTLAPDFPEKVDCVLAARDRWFPGVRTMVLTAGTELGDPAIRAACDRLDERCVKLDAGDAKTLRAVDIPLVPFELEDLVAWCRQLRDVTLQSFFTRGAVDNTTRPALDAWLARLRDIRPVEVQIYSLDRVPAAKGLRGVPRVDLESIAAEAAAAAEVPAHVY